MAIKFTDPRIGTEVTISFEDIIQGLLRTKAVCDPEKEFITIYSYLQRNRTQLARLALEYHRLRDKGVFTQLIDEVSLLGDEDWIPKDGPIDLHLGGTQQIELVSKSITPFENPLIHRGGYLSLPWGELYTENIEELNRRISEKFNLPNEFKPRLFDDPLYQLLAFSYSGSGYRIECCRNSYYPYMNHCELLHYEFARAMYMQFIDKGTSPSPGKLKRKNLKFRSSVNLYDFSNRCVGIGINTLFVMKRGDQFTFFKHKRTTATMEAINTEHVVPAGTFAPRRGIPEVPDHDFDIYKNMLRELGEELLGREDLESVHDSIEDIIKDEKIRKYHELFVDGCAKAFFLGWGIDPLTTKAEFLTAMVVDLEKYEQRFGEEPKFKHSWEGKHYHFMFNKREVEAFVNGPYTLPAGAGCTQLAWRHRKYLLGSIE